ncbi:MAG: ester cyclase, partial [bacterium]
VGCTPADNAGGVDQATVQAMVDEIWSNGNMDAVDQNYTETFVRHNPASWDPPVTEGREAFKEMIASTREQLSDLKIEIVDMLGGATARAVRWTASATHRESGNQVRFSGISFIRNNAEGKTTEEWVSFDTQGLMQQITASTETTKK